MVEVERRSVVTTEGARVGVLTELAWMFKGNTPGDEAGLESLRERHNRKKPMGDSQASTRPPQRKIAFKFSTHSGVMAWRALASRLDRV